MSAPLVLFSWQAPRLLDRYADTSAWRVQAAPWDYNSPELDHAMRVPRWTGETPVAVVVHSPEAYKQAHDLLPRARIVYMLHSADETLNPQPHPSEILVCAHAVGRYWRERVPDAVVHVVRPWYAPRPSWSWASDLVFSMLNYPGTRRPDRERFTESVMARAMSTRPEITWRHYGVQRRDGYLEGHARDELIAGCSAYVDVPPPWGGLGLGHHEMLAAGVPIVAAPWGDVDAGALPTVRPEDELAAVVVDLCRDRAAAATASQAGLDYIGTNFRQEAMHEQIGAFLG